MIPEELRRQMSEAQRRGERQDKIRRVIIAFLIGTWIVFQGFTIYYFLSHGINFPPLINSQVPLPSISIPADITNTLIALTAFSVGSWLVVSIIRFLLGIGENKELIQEIQAMRADILNNNRELAQGIPKLTEAIENQNRDRKS